MLLQLVLHWSSLNLLISLPCPSTTFITNSKLIVIAIEIIMHMVTGPRVQPAKDNVADERKQL